MDSDNTFRKVMVIGAVLVLPVAIYYRVKSQLTGERLDRRQEGLLILLTLRPIGIAGMVGLLAFLINPEWMAWSSMPLPDWLRWIGVGFGIACGCLLIWTFRNLGKNLTDTVVTRKEHTLVTTGPYRWVRHPFYASFALAVIANPLTTANWFILLTGCLAFALILLRTPKEEARLVARFGDEYRDYMNRTGRFWPKAGGRAAQDGMKPPQ